MDVAFLASMAPVDRLSGRALSAFGDGGLVVAMFWGLALIVLTVSGLIIYFLMHRRNLTGIQRVFW